MTPAPDFPTLWREHTRHRTASRGYRLERNRLARSLALLLQARLGDFLAPVPYPRWLASLGIPATTARNLLALLDPRPAPPAAILSDRQLTLRLTPLESAVTRRALSALTIEPTAPNPSQIIANAFFATTQGDLRRRLRVLRDRSRLDFDPAACAALPPIIITGNPGPSQIRSSRWDESPGRGEMQAGLGRNERGQGAYMEIRDEPERARTTHRTADRPAPAESDDHLRCLYAQFLAARRAHRREARELRRRLPALGRLLALEQQQLATPGRAGRFGAWLRRHHIPRRTAYRLIANFAPPLNCAETEIPQSLATPVLDLHASSLTIRFTSQQAVVVHAALSALLQRPARPPNLSALVISALLDHLPPEQSAPLIEFWTSSPRCAPPASSVLCTFSTVSRLIQWNQSLRCPTMDKIRTRRRPRRPLRSDTETRKADSWPCPQ